MAAIKNTEIARRSELDDPDILGVVSKQVKQRKESIAAFKKGNRPDLVAEEEAEMAILETYLPKPMTRPEIITAAGKIILEVGAKDRSDMGKVMSRLMPQLKGRADGQEVNAIITELLSKQ